MLNLQKHYKIDRQIRYSFFSVDFSVIGKEHYTFSVKSFPQKYIFQISRRCFAIIEKVGHCKTNSCEKSISPF